MQIKNTDKNERSKIAEFCIFLSNLFNENILTQLYLPEFTHFYEYVVLFLYVRFFFNSFRQKKF